MDPRVSAALFASVVMVRPATCLKIVKTQHKIEDQGQLLSEGLAISEVGLKHGLGAEVLKEDLQGFLCAPL